MIGLSSFPIEKNCDGKFRFIDGFSLDKSMLGADEMILLSLSLSQFDSSKHFSDTSDIILSKLLYPKFFNPYYINQNHLEAIDQKVLDKLKRVIREQHIVDITFEDTTVRVEPYKLTNFDGFWYWEVIVKVNANIAHYFKRRKFLQSQKILEEFDDGSLRVSFEVSHDEDIDNTIKAWLPDIYVEKPQKYKDQIIAELQEYLRTIK